VTRTSETVPALPPGIRFHLHGLDHQQGVALLDPVAGFTATRTIRPGSGATSVCAPAPRPSAPGSG